MSEALCRSDSRTAYQQAVSLNSLRQFLPSLLTKTRRAKAVEVVSKRSPRMILARLTVSGSIRRQLAIVNTHRCAMNGNSNVPKERAARTAEAGHISLFYHFTSRSDGTDRSRHLQQRASELPPKAPASDRLIPDTCITRPAPHELFPNGPRQMELHFAAARLRKGGPCGRICYIHQVAECKNLVARTTEAGGRTGLPSLDLGRVSRSRTGNSQCSSA